MSTVTSRLWFKLMGVFALVIAVGILVTVVLTRQGAATQFAHFMIDNQMLQPTRIQQSLVDYYAQQGSWLGIDQRLQELFMHDSMGNMNGMMGGMMGMMSGRLQVVDMTGQVVADSLGGRGSQPLDSQSTQRLSLVSDGHQVGTLLIEGSMMGMMGVDDQTVLSGVTRAVLIAGLVAGAVALLLGGLLVRQITQPLAGLAAASGRIAMGDLAVRVPLQSHDELGDLARTFNRMADSLETQETLRRNLMADIAHELRTPLAGIQGTVEALQDTIFPLTIENLAPIHNEVTVLNRLVEDLRTLANAEAGNLSLDHAPLNLVHLVEQQVSAFHYRAAEQKIRLQFEVHETIPTIAGDAQRLSQVLANLLDNALRHTPAGGTVSVSLAPLPQEIQLIVRDTGTGISATDLPHIFDRFYRADRSRSRQTGGSGLGLSIARQLVEAHGGQIWAESPPVGQQTGSAMGLILPIKDLIS